MDEQPPIKETRTPIPADHPRRVDYERAGTVSIFMEALSAWRQATARKRRTNRAEEVANLLEGRGCEKITHLNTHTSGAFYEAAPAGKGTGSANRVLLHAEARELAERRGLSSMTRRRHRRLVETLRISAWAVDVNKRRRGVDWQLTVPG